MSLPTAEEVTAYYLYGTNQVPSDLLDPNIASPVTKEPISVNLMEYMQSGPGRFVTAHSFDFVDYFFNFGGMSEIDLRSAMLSPGCYTKSQLFTELGIENMRNYVEFNNVFHGVDDSDYAERTYIWGTVAFAVGPETTFVVSEDGSRHIENFSILPLQMIPNISAEPENFDFTGGPVSNIGNNWLGLYDTIDPSRIGKTFQFEFASEPLDKVTISAEEFRNMPDPLAIPEVPDIDRIWGLTDRLFAAGITRFLYDDKPIIYGTSGADNLSGDLANTDKVDFHLGGSWAGLFDGHRQLEPYVKNGIVYVAGAGADTIEGTQGSDLMLGNIGNDTLIAGMGMDTLSGGEGADTYQLTLGEFDNVLIKGDTDGGTISLLSGITFRRVGNGEANTDGLYLAVDADGEWLSGKEGWSVSVSGGTATVSIPDSNQKLHTIVIENFDITSGDANKRFGITFAESAVSAVPEQTSVYDVGDGKDWNQQRLDNITVDPFENRSIVYNAADYLYHYGYETNTDGEITGPQEEPFAKTYFFDGNSKADVLNGNDWKATQQAAFDPDEYSKLVSFSSNMADDSQWVGDILQGYDGDDIITGDGKKAGDDGYDTVGDDDVLTGGKGSDTIYGGAGDDLIFAWQDISFDLGQYASYLHTSDYTGLGYDSNTYTSLYDAIYNGAVTLEDVNEKNYLDGGAGNDFIYGASYDDTIDGGSGNDFIAAGAGRDTILGGDGADVIYSDSFYVRDTNHDLHPDYIAPDVSPPAAGTAGSLARAYFYRKDTDMDTVFDPDTDYNDVIDGGAGNDVIFGEIGDDVMAGGAGDDTLFGDRPYSAGYFSANIDDTTGFQKLSARYHGDDVIDGGDGNDKIIGGGGDDRLTGGAGNDIIYGDVGVGVYDYKAAGNVPGDPSEAIEGSDNDWWGQDVLIGGAGADTLVGEGNDDTLDGGEGDDQLYGDWANWQTQAFADANGKTGNDTLTGGAGNDMLMGNSGNDTLYGGSGNDLLFGDSYTNGGIYTGTGDDVLDGGEGNDTLYGGSGNDTLTGGSGNDGLAGGAGDDIYIIGAGNGADILDDTVGSTTLQLFAEPVQIVQQGDAITMYLSSDGKNRISLSQASYSRIRTAKVGDESVDLQLTIADTGTGAISGTQGNDIVVMGNGYAGDYSMTASGGNDVLQVGDGWLDDEGYLDVSMNTWDVYGWYLMHDYIMANHATDGTVNTYSSDWNATGEIRLASGENVDLHIDGNDFANTIQGKSGDDLLYGYGGDDVLDGGVGNDTLDGGFGIDTLYGQAGDDVLYVATGDVAFGGDGNDTIHVAADGDHVTVVGGAGADIFDIATTNASGAFIEDAIFDEGDVIQLAVTADRVHVDAHSIAIMPEGETEWQYVVIYQQEQSPEGLWDRLQGLSIRFADGQTWDSATIKAIVMAGSATNDEMVGDEQANVLNGRDGYDTICGVEGNDTLYGGADNDVLSGGEGNDVFHFGLGDGSDVVVENNGWRNDADVIWLESGIAASNVSLSVQSTDDLLIKINSTGQTLTLDEFFDDSVTQQRNLSLSFNGSTNYAWASEYVQKEIFKGTANRTQRGTPTTGNNSITGTSGNDYIYGDAGNDTLSGGSGSDWLDGGAGNDTLTGGTGSDTYRFGIGSGQDVVTDGATNIAADTVRLDFTVGVGDLTLKTDNSTGKLLMGRHDANGVVTDSIKVDKALGHLVDVGGRDILVEDNGESLLQVFNNGMASNTLTLTWNPDDTRFVALTADDILTASISDNERSRWQIVGANVLSGAFLPLGIDIDDDGVIDDQAFLYLENLWNMGTNYVAFMPSSTASDASFSFRLRRDDGLTIESVMNVAMQANNGSLTGTAGSDVLDGGQSDTPLVIMAGAGNDRIFDGYGNDTVYGGNGNDVLTHNWGGNGDDTLYGEAGDDTLDAGWGIDTMIGGTGNDLYIEGNLWSGDRTTIDNTTGGEDDRDILQLGLEGYGMWDYRSLWFTRDGSDLLIDQLDELVDGEIRIKGWYADTDTNDDGILNDAGNGRLDIFVAQQDDGAVYTADVNSSHFDALINAMAQFGAKPASVSDAAGALQDEYQMAWVQIAVPAAA